MNLWGILLLLAIPTVSGIIAWVEAYTFQSVFFTVLLILGIEIVGGVAFLIMFD